VNINYFLFDLDGVLIDACNWHYESLNIALEECNFVKISEEDHFNKFNGLPSRTKLNMLGIKEIEQKKILDLKKKYTNLIIKEKCNFDTDKINFFSHLKKNNKIIACVTNSITESTHLMLKNIGIIDFFDLILCNEDVKENKPSPCPYDTAIELLNADPRKTMIIEDSKNGWISAALSKATLLWKVESTKDVVLKNFLEIFGDFS
jgi:HAD superfamily hydrolase (TIGR01509 family)